MGVTIAASSELELTYKESGELDGGARRTAGSFRPGLTNSNAGEKPVLSVELELAPVPCIYYNLPSPGQRFQG